MVNEIEPIKQPVATDLTETDLFPTTKEEAINWFHDNDWLLSNHSENIVRNECMYAYVWLHPNGVWAHGASHNELHALIISMRQGRSRLKRLAQLLGDPKTRL
jgi:hypothetical protein